MAAASLFVSDADAVASAIGGNWAGGANITSIRMMEDRSYGWFHAMALGAASNPVEPAPAPASNFVLNRNYSATAYRLPENPQKTQKKPKPPKQPKKPSAA